MEPQIVNQMVGRIYGPYTGTYFASTGETDIEHIVARSEALDSGLCADSASTKQSFARALLNPTLTCTHRIPARKDGIGWLVATEKRPTVPEPSRKKRLECL